MAGLWLDAGAWDPVAEEIKKAGHNPIPVLLPGQGDGWTSATLEDQVTAVTGAIDGCAGPVLVVGHSAACTLAWIAADARPDKTAAVVMIGGFPSPDGESYADLFECRDGAMPFPGWQAFEGPDSDDLDTARKERIAAAAVPVPEAVAKGTVRLSNPRRYELPVVIVCPEFSIEQAREWVDETVTELQQVKHVSYVDIDSGHWPMFTRPAELAQILSELAGACQAQELA